MGKDSKRKPWLNYQYEEENIFQNYTEWGSKSGAKISRHNITCRDLRYIYGSTILRGIVIDNLWSWIWWHEHDFEKTTLLVDTDDGSSLLKYKDRKLQLIVNRLSIAKIRHLNTFLNDANEVLEPGGYLMVHARTATLKHDLIMEKYVPGINYLVYYTHYFWHRVCPKLKLTKWFYFAVTKGKNRTYHRVEILGRLYRSGFEVVDEGFYGGEFIALGRKVKEPIWDDEPSCGPLVKLSRVGKDGKLIGVYKFRTMYSYSEYLQPYMYQYVGLQDGGKFAGDYRVNGWGRLFRKVWLDELPMVINLLKGQLKLVGVRPLSRHYFSLYTKEMQELRIKVKPGLIPPFYYEKETPHTVEDVQESERRYIESYLEHPLKTDWKYFWGSLFNIVFRRKRSK